METTPTTVFGPALETMKTVKSPDGEMLTKPFLNVCRNVLPVIGNWVFQESSSSSFCLRIWLLSSNLFLFLFFFPPVLFCFVLVLDDIDASEFVYQLLGEVFFRKTLE
jgi:hypothetical protein